MKKMSTIVVLGCVCAFLAVCLMFAIEGYRELERENAQLTEDLKVCNVYLKDANEAYFDLKKRRDFLGNQYQKLVNETVECRYKDADDAK